MKVPLPLGLNLRPFPMENPETDLHIPIFVRAHARLADPPRRREWQPKPMPQWARHALVLDTETTRTLDQELNFGFAQWGELDPSRDIYVSQEEYIFHRNNLDPKSLKLLREFARKHRLGIMSRDEFVNGPLWDAVTAGASIVGFNLPYDISVLAHSYREAGEGWSFVMWPYPNGRENKSRPRIRISTIDSRRAIIILAGGRLRNKDGTPAPCRWPIPGGRFLDLAHMVFALRNSYFSLKVACK